MLKVSFLCPHSLGGGPPCLLTVCLSFLQEPLKGSVISAMKTVLRSYTDVCDAVFVVEIGLRFLGKTGGDPQSQLLSYLADSLQMSSQISFSVVKVETCRPTAASQGRLVLSTKIQDKIQSQILCNLASFNTEVVVTHAHYVQSVHST